MDGCKMLFCDIDHKITLL